MESPAVFKFKDKVLDLSRPKLMGVLNITPDSFSDGGCFQTIETALGHAQRLTIEGADVLDIGAESTRPGHTPLNAEEEISRLTPILQQISTSTHLPISVDTYKAKTAEAALNLGADIINDIWGLNSAPEMANMVGYHGAGIIIMHNRVEKDENVDILADMIAYFEIALEKAHEARLPKTNIMLDPGIGFGKTHVQNLDALKAVKKLKTYFKLPLLVGASRKSFINLIHESNVSQRLAGTLTAHLNALKQGADMLRVHDVADHAQALAVEYALRQNNE